MDDKLLKQQEVAEIQEDACINEEKKEKMKGMPKSGKPWKKLSKRANSINKSKRIITWDERMRRKDERKDLQKFLKDIKDEKEEIYQKERSRLKDKKKRDELNKYKTATVQLISNSKKVNKWTKKMRKNLIKLPPEIYEKLLEKKGRNII